MGGSAASASVVYKAINMTLQESDLTLSEPALTIGAVHFDGTTITADHSSAGGAAVFTSVDSVTSLGTNYIKVAGYLAASGGYTQTPELLQKDAAFGDAFLQSSSSSYLPPGSATAYIGISTPNKQYGWVRFSYTDAGKTITILDAAFESTPNTPIAVGATASGSAAAVPSHPAATAGLTGLAGGLTMLRRKRTGNSGEA
ncbi:MAG: hypothetical protein JWO82_2054 [Akkermansiaceae bacterium]|nr:hypothetical protein [Akkermansiaceae bacterium]